MPAEMGEVTEAEPEPLLKEVFGCEHHEAEDAFAEAERKEEVPEMFQETREGAEVQPEAKDIGESFLLLQQWRRSGLSLGRAILCYIDRPGSTSLSRYYSRAKLEKLLGI